MLVALVAGWLVFEQGLTSREAWRQQLKQWRGLPGQQQGSPAETDRAAQTPSEEVSPLVPPDPIEEAVAVEEPVPQAPATAATTAIEQPEDVPPATNTSPPQETRQALDIIPAPIEQESGSETPVEDRTESPPADEPVPLTEAAPSPAIEPPQQLVEEVPSPPPRPAHPGLQLAFGIDSDDLSVEATDRLDELVDRVAATTWVTMTVVGFADPLAETAPEQALSQRRAEVVARYIVAGGVDAGRLAVAGLGAFNPAQYGDNMPGEPLSHSRLVLVTLP